MAKNKIFLCVTVLIVVFLIIAGVGYEYYFNNSQRFERGIKNCHSFIGQPLLSLSGDPQKVPVYSPWCITNQFGKTSFLNTLKGAIKVKPKDLIIRSINLTQDFKPSNTLFLTVNQEIVENPILAKAIASFSKYVIGDMVPLEKPTGYITICGKTSNESSSQNILLSTKETSSSIIKGNYVYFCSNLINTQQAGFLDVGFITKSSIPDIKLNLYFPPKDKWGEKITTDYFYNNFNYFVPFNISQL